MPIDAISARNSRLFNTIIYRNYRVKSFLHLFKTLALYAYSFCYASAFFMLKKLKIEKAPSLLVQQGKRLKVEEIVLK